MLSSVLLLLLSLVVVAAQPARAQQNGKRIAPPQADRVPAHPRLEKTTRLPGHVPGWVKAASDAGAVEDETPVRLTFVLRRAPQVEAAYTQLLADQQNPRSPDYHQWLTPQQIGDLYGPTENDVQALRGWLISQGLSVRAVAPSRMFVEATGSAATVSKALATHLRYFRLPAAYKSEGLHRAATSEPSIPSDFVPLVQAISGLSDSIAHPLGHGRAGAAPQGSGGVLPQPAYTTSSGNHYVTPADFATIFDIQRTYNDGINGAGQKVAIIGRSRVTAADITNFEANTGLASYVPNVVVPTGATDPGSTANGDQLEATLDVDRVIGTAPGVQIDLVISASSSGGIENAANYNVQTLLDPVMNISFGSCEANQGASGVNYWNTLFTQAAGEGISSFVSSGDDGADACAANNSVPPVSPARGINYICSSSYVTCAGGTEFADAGNYAAYWSTSNSTGFESAMGYIPEGAWNEPSSTSSGVTTYSDSASSGGASIYITKPVWQTGTGVPADGARDVPDIAYPASAHDGYYACLAYAGNGCTAGQGFEYFYGTSAAAPSMAGLTALLDQRLGARQGNLNPLIYRLANASYSSGHNPFNDITPASSGVSNCLLTTPSMCNNSSPSPTALTGGLQGYLVTTGYDLVTGWGSVDVSNFLAAASGSLATTTIGVTPSSTLLYAPPQASVTLTATLTSQGAGTPGGAITFYDGGNSLGAGSALSGGKSGLSSGVLATGVHTITAVYAGDGLFAGSTSAVATVTVMPSTIGVTASSSALTLVSATSLTVTDALTVSSLVGYAGTTGLTCAISSTATTNMPTCSVAPASVVLAVGGSAAATLTVSTIKGVACPAVVQGPHESGPGIALGAIFLLSLLPLRRRGRGHSLLALLLLSLAVSSLAGCSKSSSTPSAPICQVIVAPPAGAYTVVVTAADTSGSPTAKATIALTVQ